MIGRVTNQQFYAYNFAGKREKGPNSLKMGHLAPLWCFSLVPCSTANEKFIGANGESVKGTNGDHNRHR